MCVADSGPYRFSVVLQCGLTLQVAIMVMLDYQGKDSWLSIQGGGMAQQLALLTRKGSVIRTLFIIAQFILMH